MPLPVYSPCMNVSGVSMDDQLELISSYFKQEYMVKRITVMKLLRELDPEGVESRKRKRLRRRIYHR